MSNNPTRSPANKITTDKLIYLKASNIAKLLADKSLNETKRSIGMEMGKEKENENESRKLQDVSGWLGEMEQHVF